jgi:hypothetical protein
MQMALSVADRFTIAEVEALGRRFAWLDERLRSSQRRWAPGFQGSETEYCFDEPAEPVTFRRFLATWG